MKHMVKLSGMNTLVIMSVLIMAFFLFPGCMAEVQSGNSYPMGGSLQGEELDVDVPDTLGGTTGACGSSDTDLTSSTFCFPRGLTTDGDYIYVADSGRHLIRKIDIDNQTVTTLTSSLSKPTGIVVWNSYVYVADAGSNTIRKVSVLNGTVTPIAGTEPYSGYVSGNGTGARFNNPTAITTDNKDLYVCDTGNHAIRKINIDDTTLAVSTFAGYFSSSDNNSQTGSTDQFGTSARFSSPQGITSDGTNLYVCDTGNHTVRKITISTRKVTTLAGSAGSSGYSDGNGSSARFFWPMAITCDGTNLYVADMGNNLIRKIVISSEEVTTAAGTALTAGTTDVSPGKFSGPSGITNDAAKVYVADTQNQIIRAVKE